MMERVPRLLASVVRRLLPPADREHVIGDLQERAASTTADSAWRPLADAVQTVPFVIMSRARRQLVQPFFGLQILLLFVAFVAALTNTTRADAFRLLLLLYAAAPALIAAGVLLLADVYTTSVARSPWLQLILVALALGVAWFSNQLAVALHLPWALPQATIERALVFGFLGLAWVRFMRVFHQTDRYLDLEVPRTPETLRAHALGFHEEIRRRNRGAYAVCFLVGAAFARVGMSASNGIEMIGAGIVVLGSVYLAIQVSRFSPVRVPLDADYDTSLEFYRTELTRQHNFHSGKALTLRLMALLPGPIVLSLGMMVSRPDRFLIVSSQIAVFVVLATLAFPLNLRLARRYQRRLKNLDDGRRSRQHGLHC